MKKIFLYIITILYLVGFILVNYFDFVPKNLEKIVDNFLKTFFILIIVFFVNIIIDKILLKIVEKNDNLSKSFYLFSKKILNFFLFLISFATIISSLGYNINAIITGAGIGGVAIALASQKTVANFFGALNVILNKPFKIGDNIGIGNQQGVVKDIGLIYLKIINNNGNEVYIPNETLISSSIENFSNRESRKIELNIILDKTADITKILHSINNILEKHKNDIYDYRANFDSFTENGFNILIVYYSKIKDIKQIQKIKENINLEIKQII